MTTTTPGLHPLADEYLHRLKRAARRLPRRERQELLDEIQAHLSEATDPGMSDAQVLTVLDRLGEPEDIVDAQREDEERRPDGRGVREWSAIFLLLFGGFVVGIGWIAGAILLWSSRAWTTRDKLIGTLVVPGGLATALFAALAGLLSGSYTCTSVDGGPEHCVGAPSPLHQAVLIAVFALVLIGPIFTSVYLARRAR